MDSKNTEKSDVAQREEEMLAFWRANNVFNKSVETPAGNAPVGDFVFYDGPPFATGTPHYGHILAGTIKDAIPRFWTMNGYRVKRTWGWDCHGLPLENIIEKRLGLATKRDIEELGVKKFNDAAREAVLEYADDWKKAVQRMGRFVDMEDDYRTMDSSYTESVWWVFSELNKRGLVYEGFKSMHLCPRCGTTLSNFEVNQGYKDIKDIAVTVKLVLDSDQKIGDIVTDKDTSLLVWTTTPWTLPGNTAAAINNDVMYEAIKGEEGTLILARKFAQDLVRKEAYTTIAKFKGSELVGKSYKPPFDYMNDEVKEGKENAWKIYHADYVEVGEEGTGAVHIAPAYGDDDMQLAKERGIPIVHHVDTEGHFKDFVTDFAGQLVKPKDDEASGVDHKDADIQILKKLQEKGLALKKENITHSYPHCWRCETPLLNYATTSWFVRVTDIKEKLVAENAKVKWVPEHVGTNRFGKWLEGARDWAVSRQRYWGAPLPIWKNQKTGEHKIFGSLNELKEYVPKSGNSYFLMRHGESDKNVEPRIVTDDIDAPYHLTEKGKQDVRDSVAQLNEKIDFIITSPVLRTRETAELVATELGLESNQILIDERIREIEHGVYEGRPLNDFYTDFPNDITRFENRPKEGENWSDIKKRMGQFLYSLEKEYKGQNILIVSHGDPTQLLNTVVRGASNEEIIKTWEDEYLVKGAISKLDFTPMPHNENYELDFHRPYIDEIELIDTDGERLVRVPDVFDCWFESGSMPYGQKHFMGEALSDFNPEKGIGYPAQFIAEGLDQTRGWFYSLMVLGTALFDKAPFERVVVNGLVLAEDGKKMSKSLQNYPDPMELTDRVGADAIRLYLLMSPVVRGEDMSFSEKDVLDVQRKNIGRLHNVLAMYEMFAGKDIPARDNSPHVLDVWIIARLNEVIAESTLGYTNYELDKATRPLEGLIDDISVWYLRRSRDRIKGEDIADKELALRTLRFVLKNLALVMAPVMPFYAEHLFLRVREESDAESVHLCAWPKGGKVDQNLVADMANTRLIVTDALNIRTAHNVKVRQPLQSLSFRLAGERYFISSDNIEGCIELIREEVNVKEVVSNEQFDEELKLNTNITPELKQEGDVREFMRAIQDARKNIGLSPEDRVTLFVSEEMKVRMGNFESTLMSVVGAHEVRTDGEKPNEIKIDGVVYTFGVEKI